MKYTKRLTVDLPKPLFDELDRIILKDGRKRAEVVRTLIVQFIREQKLHTPALPHRATPA